MTIRAFTVTVLALAVAAGAAASDIAIRNASVMNVSRPDGDDRQAMPQNTRLMPLATALATAPDYNNLPLLRVYPVAGTVGRDLFVPYFVDVDPSNGIRDFRCGASTFDGHTGHDPYIRSFAEQSIGVPVFAPLDGVVTATHDGEPDENTTSPSVIANFVELDHGSGLRSLYLHFRNGSVSVKVGDQVVAGQQIGMVGSSGMSSAPHTHFELTSNGTPIEPMAGPCRPGRSLLANPPIVSSDPALVGATLNTRPFSSDFATSLHDASVQRTGTFYPGHQTVYVKLDVANLPVAGGTYTVRLTNPNGVVSTAATKIDGLYPAYLAAVRIDVDANLDFTGDYSLSIDVNGKHLADLPFTVIAAGAFPANRSPNPITASIEPITLQPGDVPVCRANGSVLADPDYQIVFYRYEWKVGDRTVRSVTSAARSDALARNLIRANDSVSCSVVVSDGQNERPAVTAFANVVAPRRRVASH